MGNSRKMKIAFVVGYFPKVSETFIIDQACDLIDRGIEVTIYAFNKGRDMDNISERYFSYKLDERTKYINSPANKISRILLAIPRLILLSLRKPHAILKFITSPHYLKFLSWNTNMFSEYHDLYHCHFGGVALNFVIIKEILGIKEKFITSLYGNDISKGIRERGVGAYREVIQECSLFFVMSENMKERVVGYGFPPNKVLVHPVGIDLDKYSYQKNNSVDPVNIISVGRFVEKKGFDDLIRALAIVKEKTTKKFKCYIVGDGPLREKIYSMVESLKLQEVIDFKGFMPMDKIAVLFKQMHFFVQPSKTARDGDME